MRIGEGTHGCFNTESHPKASSGSEGVSIEDLDGYIESGLPRWLKEYPSVSQLKKGDLDEWLSEDRFEGVAEDIEPCKFVLALLAPEIRFGMDSMTGPELLAELKAFQKQVPGEGKAFQALKHELYDLSSRETRHHLLLSNPSMELVSWLGRSRVHIQRGTMDVIRYVVAESQAWRALKGEEIIQQLDLIKDKGFELNQPLREFIQEEFTSPDTYKKFWEANPSAELVLWLKEAGCYPRVPDNLKRKGRDTVSWLESLRCASPSLGEGPRLEELRVLLKTPRFCHAILLFAPSVELIDWVESMGGELEMGVPFLTVNNIVDMPKPILTSLLERKVLKTLGRSVLNSLVDALVAKAFGKSEDRKCIQWHYPYECDEAFYSDYLRWSRDFSRKDVKGFDLRKLYLKTAEFCEVLDRIDLFLDADLLTTTAIVDAIGLLTAQEGWQGSSKMDHDSYLKAARVLRKIIPRVKTHSWSHFHTHWIWELDGKHHYSNFSNYDLYGFFLNHLRWQSCVDPAWVDLRKPEQCQAALRETLLSSDELQDLELPEGMIFFCERNEIYPSELRDYLKKGLPTWVLEYLPRSRWTQERIERYQDSLAECFEWVRENLASPDLNFALLSTEAQAFVLESGLVTDGVPVFDFDFENLMALDRQVDFMSWGNLLSQTLTDVSSLVKEGASLSEVQKHLKSAEDSALVSIFSEEDFDSDFT